MWTNEVARAVASEVRCRTSIPVTVAANRRSSESFAGSSRRTPPRARASTDGSGPAPSPNVTTARKEIGNLPALGFVGAEAMRLAIEQESIQIHRAIERALLRRGRKFCAGG